MKIRIENLTHKYSTHTALENINITINKGDFVALLGHNGSGKTTLVKALLKEIAVCDKTIYLDETDINCFKDWNSVGYVAQKFTNFSFNYPINVEEILRTSLNDKNKIEEVLNLTNLNDVCDKNFNTLSGGQQQRVFIARAIINSPKLLILDEPFVGVDSDNILSLYKLLKTINKQGTTIILITHQAHFVKQFTNKTIVLKNRIFYDGASEDYDDRMCELC